MAWTQRNNFVGLLIIISLVVPFFGIGLPCSGFVTSSLPDWIKPGTILTYQMLSAGISNIGYQDSSHTLLTYTITSVNGNSVQYTVSTSNIEYPNAQKINKQFSWKYGEIQDPSFWVDPSNPTKSVLAPNGMPYSIVADNGKEVTMEADIRGAASKYVLTYDKNTGIVLTNSHSTPTEEIDIFYYSSNIQ